MDGRSRNRTLHFFLNENRMKHKPVFVGNTVQFHEIFKYL
jgi:hypothetical protein